MAQKALDIWIEHGPIYNGEIFHLLLVSVLQRYHSDKHLTLRHWGFIINLDRIWEAGNKYLIHSLGVHVSESSLECIWSSFYSLKCFLELGLLPVSCMVAFAQNLTICSALQEPWHLPTPIPTKYFTPHPDLRFFSIKDQVQRNEVGEPWCSESDRPECKF